MAIKGWNCFTLSRFRRQQLMAVPNRMAFEVTADGFLRYMVRNIVGTLVMVGLRKITSEQFRVILESRDRARAAATAPARGLFLVGVSYE